MRRPDDLIQRLNAALYHRPSHTVVDAEVLKMDGVAGSPHPAAFEGLKRAINEAKVVFGEPQIGVNTRTPNGLKPNKLKRGAIENNSAILVWLVQEAERLIARLEQEVATDH